MSKATHILLIASAVISIGAVLLWQATGGDYYTKFQVLEQVEKKVDPDDPLATAGFYDTESTVETVRRDEFRFGLLPTPSGLIDRHILAVLSVAGPFWGISIISILVDLKRRRKS
jgi:hypothetical protein